MISEVKVYPKNRFKYCRLQADHEKTPLFPANVGDIMFPSVFRQGFPSPSWIIPKLGQKKGGSKRGRYGDCEFYQVRLLMYNLRTKNTPGVRWDITSITESSFIQQTPSMISVL